MSTGSFPGGKERPGCDADPSPPSSAVVHERVELYLYSPYGPYGLYRASVPVQGCTLPLCGYIVFLANCECGEYRLGASFVVRLGSNFSIRHLHAVSFHEHRCRNGVPFNERNEIAWTRVPLNRMAFWK